MLNLLYIHGFNSSPHSMKATLSKAFFKKNYPELNFHCPQLATSPQAAIAQLEQIIAQAPTERWLLLGSSLGGYFSTYFSEKYQFPAVLINPAVKPFVLIEELIGEHVNPYTTEVYNILPEFVDDLKLLEQTTINKNNYMVMVQTGDEVLDYQQAVEKYRHCEMIVQDGGDHSFINFEEMLPPIALFFNL